MAVQKQSRAVRLTLTVIVAVAGLLVSWSVFRASRNAAPSGQRASAPAAVEGSAAKGESAASSQERVASAPMPVAPATPATVGGVVEEGVAESTPTPVMREVEGVRVGLRARAWEAPQGLTPIGSITDGQHRALVEFTTYGAGVEAITLSQYETAVGSGVPYPVQQRVVKPANGSGATQTVASLAAVGVELRVGDSEPEFVDLRVSDGKTLWRETGVGSFEALIEDGTGRGVARIERRYELADGSLDIRVTQRLHNLTGDPLGVVWYQYGPVDLPADTGGYRIEVRRFRWGTLLPARQDPSRQFVHADRTLLSRQSAITKSTKPVHEREPLWPPSSASGAGHEPVWFAMTNRYFAFIVHPLLDPAQVASGAGLDKRFGLVEKVHGVVVGSQSGEGSLVAQFTSPTMEAPAGGVLDLSFGAYAGPMLPRMLAGNPVQKALSLDDIVVYNIGGMCAMCTFEWLTHPLIWFLRFVHDYLLHDWALAIMMLVLVVRTVLHPVTRRSQIGIAKFSKQMGALAPKQKALQEKFKDDPKRLQQEMGKLMREQGVSFTGALGCLPMFLQTPVWIALYAMLYFAFELRHEPAFFGVFQALSGGRWEFLSDLAAPDHFIPFSSPVHIPLLSSLMGELHGFNILPIVLGVVFFIQQKYLTPPPTTAMTPEQQTQQKMMKVMMVVLFPLTIFNAPSGLSLYFITNSTLGILESRWIRSHIDTLDTSPKKKGGEGAGGFWKRVQNEALKRQQTAQRGQRPGGAAGRGRGGGAQRPKR